jgi:hypothetical protein
VCDVAVTGKVISSGLPGMSVELREELVQLLDAHALVILVIDDDHRRRAA